MTPGNHTTIAGATEGERRKADAHALLASRRESLVRRAQRALLETLLVTGTATADDVRDLVDLPPSINAKVFGGVPGPLARAAIIARAGYAKTCRPTAHARPVSIWRLIDRAAAERWLRDHPATSDAADDAPAAQGLLLGFDSTNNTGAAVAAATPVV